MTLLIISLIVVVLCFVIAGGFRVEKFHPVAFFGLILLFIIAVGLGLLVKTS